jgi:hypothetical protein
MTTQVLSKYLSEGWVVKEDSKESIQLIRPTSTFIGDTVRTATYIVGAPIAFATSIIGAAGAFTIGLGAVFSIAARENPAPYRSTEISFDYALGVTRTTTYEVKTPGEDIPDEERKMVLDFGQECMCEKACQIFTDINGGFHTMLEPFQSTYETLEIKKTFHSA